MTSLRQALSDYLRVRRRLGFQLNTDQRLLETLSSSWSGRGPNGSLASWR